MVFEIQAFLPDEPGTLIQFLKPISDNSGNIFTVLHMHDQSVEGKIAVLVKFSLNNLSKLEIIQDELQKKNIEVFKVTKILDRDRLVVILIGDVFETDFIDTYRQIETIGGDIKRLDARFKGLANTSAVKFEILIDKDKIDLLLTKLEEICIEKKLTLIKDR